MAGIWIPAEVWGYFLYHAGLYLFDLLFYFERVSSKAISKICEEKHRSVLPLPDGRFV